MKLQRMFLFLSLFIVLFIAEPVFAEEKINNFDAYIKINTDASITVTENINYDFGEFEKHGIFRDIPLQYQTSFGNKSIKLQVQNIQRDGMKEKYIIDNVGINKNIKIGDSNINISGKHLYTITYKVKGAIGYFDNFDELYWNISGNDWPVKIENFNAKIELPENTDMSKTKYSCYLGIFSSTEKCSFEVEKNFVTSKNIRLLNVGEGVTLAVGFPKQTIYQPTQMENIISTCVDNYIVFLPIVVFIIMFLIWRKYGKDPKGHSTIIAEYEPPENISPSLIGVIVRGNPTLIDITSGIIYLAEKGVVKITRIEEKSSEETDEEIFDYEIELVKDDVTILEKVEKNILNLFLGEDLYLGKKIKTSTLRNQSNFSMKFQKVIKMIYQEITVMGFYAKNPLKAKMPYLIIGPVFILFGLFLFPQKSGIIGVVSVIISGLIIVIFGIFMSKRTKQGAEIKNYILGFKMFLSMTEKDRLDFHNAPESDSKQFMKFLPYAIALGVEKKWVEQFKNINISQPSWYYSNITGSFVVSDFVSDMGAVAGSSGSGGRGFSGGGSGGGGGGSW